MDALRKALRILPELNELRRLKLGRKRECVRQSLIIRTQTLVLHLHERTWLRLPAYGILILVIRVQEKVEMTLI